MAGEPKLPQLYVIVLNIQIKPNPPQRYRNGEIDHSRSRDRCDLTVLYKVRDIKKIVLLFIESVLLFSLLPGEHGGVPTNDQETRYGLEVGVSSYCLNYALAENNNPQSLVDGEKSTTVNATTVFTSDANVAHVSPDLGRSVPRILHDSSSTNFHQDIVTFLEKPVVLTSGVLSTTDSTPISLYSGILPQDVLNTAQIYKDKVRGFLGFRADIFIRWQVNGTRFQQGRYMLAWVPSGGSAPNGANPPGAAAYASHVNTLTSRSQLFRVELDVTCDTEGTLTIPFLSCMNYVPLSSLNGSNYGALGQLTLYPYSPLEAVSGSTTASYTIWVNFQNVELIGPATPQAGGGKFSNSKKKKSETEAEQNSQGLGPVSSMLVKVSNASSILGAVPLLGDYAKTISWFADIGASAASVFGWSSPLNLSAPMVMKRVALSNFGVIDAADESLPLSASVRNQVGILDGFSGTDVDEMDFSFLKTIPFWYRTFNWGVLNNPGDELTSINVTPNLLSTRTQGGLSIVDLGPCAFISEHFKYWRGSMVYTLKFVKTEFHSGRVAVAFFPYELFDTNVGGMNYAGSNYVHREIIDLRLCNEVTFTIPYISSSSWRPTSGNNYIGVLKVFVVDPLVAPVTVPSVVRVILEPSMGPDGEFAVPKSVSLTPIMNATPQSGEGSFSNPKPSANECALTESTLGMANPKSDNNMNALYTIGENVSNFRSLLKMQNTTPPIGALVPRAYSITLPFACPVVYINGTDVTYPSHTCDLYSRLNSIYLFSRGGVRIKTLNSVSGAQDLAGVSYLDVFDTGSAYLGTSYQYSSVFDTSGTSRYNLRYAGPQQQHHTHQNLGVEVQIPQYHKWHSRVCSEHMVNSQLPYGGGGSTKSLATPLLWNYRFSNATEAYAIPTRSGSDDCNYGTFISIPPMVNLESTLNVA